MPLLTGTLTHFSNPKSDPTLEYSNAQRDILSVAASKQAIADISQWPGYKETPLHAFTSIAAKVGIAQLWYKDESQRFGLKSFKALGGAYAVARQLQIEIFNRFGKSPTITELLDGKWRSEVAEIVVSCATDGNHGRSVAWGAQMFGCGCVIYIHRDVSEGRKTAMEAFGAEVIRISGNYDESVRTADSEAKAHNRVIVSDTSYEGYMDIPKDVALGYTAMLAEIVEQLDGTIPSHVFVQGGVGGLASAVCGYFWDLWGEKRPRFVIVEPEQANCLQKSAKAGEPVVVEGDLDTLMAGLACGEVSTLAWEILKNGADDFMTLSEEAVPQAMRLLAGGYQSDTAVEAGESAVPGLAAAIIASEDADFSQALGLNSESRVLVIGTEGATDPGLYHQIINE
ncbi:diaminopropionate ammonia-lyase [Vibrio coralliilyticus]|uniref:Diaminopropionate ammonia-lyase n=1 Tax=Vibrio coralliilyticus TaxID=190893 RepID=A0A7M2K674_9VIBR|nr:diaminopropionate ammonia-lyase [Vibrio coralliilyticus]KJY73134.1 diaminopropionate ammonia-lyase [Vibrio coralliilyticus]QOU31649.1 diaminopropionate ammonia-lyase [Vibrio coralliilyticus]